MFYFDIIKHILARRLKILHKIFFIYLETLKKILSEREREREREIEREREKENSN